MTGSLASVHPELIPEWSENPLIITSRSKPVCRVDIQ